MTDPAQERLLTWAAQLVRIVCGHSDDDMAEQVRRVALEMRDAHDAVRAASAPTPTAKPGIDELKARIERAGWAYAPGSLSVVYVNDVVDWLDELQEPTPLSAPTPTPPEPHLQTTDPAVVACMGSVPECAANGCQFRKTAGYRLGEGPDFAPTPEPTEDELLPVVCVERTAAFKAIEAEREGDGLTHRGRLLKAVLLLDEVEDWIDREGDVVPDEIVERIQTAAGLVAVTARILRPPTPTLEDTK